MNKRGKKVSVAVFVFGALLIAGIVFIRSGRERSAAREAYSIIKTIGYGYTVRNMSNRPVTGGILKTFAPVRQTPYQWCDRIEATHAFERVEDLMGNQMLIFRLETVPPYGSKVIEIMVHMRFSDKPNAFLSDPPETCLSPEPLIQSTAPEIVELAASLSGTSSTFTARRCFGWVSGGLTYSGYRSASRGALRALRQRTGDCTEFTALFVALCRANTIPSRLIAGYAAGDSSRLRPSDYHNWAEFFSAGRWQGTDPQKHCFDIQGSSYVAMHIPGPGSPLSESDFRYGITGAHLDVTME